MATNPTPQPLTSKPYVPDASAYLANIVQDMHSHTVKVTYMFVAIIVLVLSLGSVGGYLGLKAYEAQLARAETREAQYQTSLAAFQSALAENTVARAAAEAQVAQLQAQIAKRASQPLPAPVQTGLKPDATAEQAKTAIEAVYGADKAFGALPPVQGPNVALSVPQAQAIISTKIGLDRTSADLRDEIQIAGLQKTTIDSLQNDLNTCKAVNLEANKTIDAYKKIATKSKFRKFLDGAEKVGLLLAGGVIGHVI